MEFKPHVNSLDSGLADPSLGSCVSNEESEIRKQHASSISHLQLELQSVLKALFQSISKQWMMIVKNCLPEQTETNLFWRVLQSPFNLCIYMNKMKFISFSDNLGF